MQHWYCVPSCGLYKPASVIGECPRGTAAPLRNPAVVIILLSAIKGAGGTGAVGWGRSESLDVDADTPEHQDNTAHLTWLCVCQVNPHSYRLDLSKSVWMPSRHTRLCTGALTQALLSLTACFFTSFNPSLMRSIITCQHAVNWACIMYDISTYACKTYPCAQAENKTDFILNQTIRWTEQSILQRHFNPNTTVMSTVFLFVAQTPFTWKGTIPAGATTAEKRYIKHTFSIITLTKWCILYSK